MTEQTLRLELRSMEEDWHLNNYSGVPSGATFPPSLQEGCYPEPEG